MQSVQSTVTNEIVSAKDNLWHTINDTKNTLNTEITSAKDNLFHTVTEAKNSLNTEITSARDNLFHTMNSVQTEVIGQVSANMNTAVSGVNTAVAGVQGTVNGIQGTVGTISSNVGTVSTGVTDIIGKVQTIDTNMISEFADVDTDLSTLLTNVNGLVTTLEQIKDGDFLLLDLVSECNDVELLALKTKYEQFVVDLQSSIDELNDILPNVLPTDCIVPFIELGDLISSLNIAVPSHRIALRLLCTLNFIVDIPCIFAPITETIRKIKNEQQTLAANPGSTVCPQFPTQEDLAASKATLAALTGAQGMVPKQLPRLNIFLSLFKTFAQISVKTFETLDEQNQRCLQEQYRNTVKTDLQTIITDTGAAQTAVIGNSDANTAAIQTNDNTNKDTIVTNDNANTSTILANDNANTGTVINNDNINKDTIIANDNINTTSVIGNDNSNTSRIITDLIDSASAVIDNDDDNTFTILTNDNTNKDTILTNDNANTSSIVANDNTNTTTIVNNDNNNTSDIITNDNSNLNILLNDHIVKRDEVVDNDNYNTLMIMTLIDENQIEEYLVNKEKKVAALIIPVAFGGKLELVRDVVQKRIDQFSAAGFDTKDAVKEIDKFDNEFIKGEYGKAYEKLINAYEKLF